MRTNAEVGRRFSALVALIWIILLAAVPAWSGDSGEIVDALGRGESLDRTSIAAIQKSLNGLGYDVGPADGLVGPKTRDGLARWFDEWQKENTVQPAMRQAYERLMKPPPKVHYVYIVGDDGKVRKRVRCNPGERAFLHSLMVPCGATLRAAPGQIGGTIIHR